MNKIDIESIFTVFDTANILGDEDSLICKGCKSSKLIEDFSHGTVVCTDCGLVNKDTIIDESAEWNFGAEDSQFSKDPSRCGGPTNALLEKSSLSTMINISRSRGNNYTMAKIHQQQSMNYVERSLYHVFEEIQKMGAENGSLPQSILDQAKGYYKKISEKRLSRGSIRKGLIACCIFYACKAHNVPRSVKEISKMCNIEVGILNKTTKIFSELMKDEINNNKGINVDDLLSRFVSIFQFETKEHHAILKTVRKVHEYVLQHNILHGKTPTSTASGIIYFVLSTKGYTVDKQLITQHHKISMVTLSKILSILKSSDASGVIT